MTQIDIVERLKDAQNRLSDGDEQNYGNVSYFADEAIDIAIAEITALRAKVAARESPNAPDENGFYVGQKVTAMANYKEYVGIVAKIGSPSNAQIFVNFGDGHLVAFYAHELWPLP